MNIEKLDKNFAVGAGLSRTDVKVYDVCEPPFSVCGLIKPRNSEDRFRRIPNEIAQTVSEGVYCLASNTAGGRVRFKTNSAYIAIKAEMPENGVGKMAHFAITGSAGFDMYSEIDGVQSYVKTFVPPFDMKTGYVSEYAADCREMREYTLNFPLYSNVSKLYIILEENAELEECRPYRVNKPIVYYGSSITQGGCASRPGNSYQSIISRRLDCDFINLGFSGNAKGEAQIAEYIAKLDMSVFVYDYDHNAPTVEHLQNTHERMFNTIREANPELPIVCVSRPVCLNEDAEKRRRVIMDTVEKAESRGDKNVYFVDGKSFFAELNAGDSITVDGCHPNDLGFMCMANVIGRTIEGILADK